VGSENSLAYILFCIQPPGRHLGHSGNTARRVNLIHGIWPRFNCFLHVNQAASIQSVLDVVPEYNRAPTTQLSPGCQCCDPAQLRRLYLVYLTRTILSQQAQRRHLTTFDTDNLSCITCVAACLLCYTRCFAHLSSIRQTEAAPTVIYLNVRKSDRMCWCGRHEYHNLSEIVLAHTLTTSIVP
jgi:hypothetical protein